MNNRSLQYPLFIAGLFMAACFSSCVKDRNDLNTDFSKLEALMEIRTPVVNQSGLLNFAAATLFFSGDPDTVSFYVNLASVNTLNRDITVNVDIDNAALEKYNASNSAGDPYELFPDSTFSFTQKQVTVKAGSRVAMVSVIYYPSKIDPSKNYMLPVSIKDASGINISANFSTIYYHVIGNPLAGNYFWDFTRWNNNDGSGAPSSLSFTGEQTTFVPDNATTIQVQSGYYIGPRYVLSFTNGGGTLSNFSVKFNEEDIATMTSGGVTIVNGPNIVQADPVGKRFKLQFIASTSSGFRYITDEYYQ